MAAGDRQLTVTDLRVSVYLRALHPEFFRIRVRRSIAHSALDSEVWLLDGGHVITFVDGPNAITEVLAPRDLELPKRGLARTVDLSEACTRSGALISTAILAARRDSSSRSSSLRLSVICS